MADFAPRPSQQAVPHYKTFAAILNAANSTYFSRFDEALKNSITDTLAMPNDGLIYELMSARIRPVASLRWTLKPEDAKDPDQAAVVDGLTKLVGRIPYPRRFMNSLLHASWFGRSAVQLGVDYVDVGGVQRVGIAQHTPVNGDKLTYRWDGVPGIYVSPQFEPVRGNKLVANNNGMALFLDDPYYRDRFLIHEFDPVDKDFLFQGDQAGAIHGLGLRNYLYWLWYLRQELSSWAFDGLQRIGSNGMLVGYFPSGMKESQEQLLEFLRNLVRDNVGVFPVMPGLMAGQGGKIERLDPATLTYDVLKLFIDWLEDTMRRVVLGQNLSSQSDSPGLGGGKVAELHETTFDSIKRADAIDLAQTLEIGLLKERLIPWNSWKVRGQTVRKLPFEVKWEFHVDDAGALEKLQGAQILIACGVELDKEELRDLAGLSAPKSPETSVGGPAALAPPGPDGKPGASPAPKPAAIPPPKPPAAPVRFAKDRGGDPGVMIGYFLPTELAAELAIPGGEEPGELHLTLAYLGRVSEVGDRLPAIERLCQALARSGRDFVGSIGGLGVFPGSDSSDGLDVLYAPVDVPGLSAYRARLAATLADLGAPPSADHDFTPHVTLAYVTPGTPPTHVPARRRLLLIDRLVLAVGDVRGEYRLAEDGPPVFQRPFGGRRKATFGAGEGEAA